MPDMARCSFIAALLGIAVVTGPRTAADEPSLKEVVRRMGAYVQAYGDKASIVVATEGYTQEVRASDQAAPERRITVADFAIVKAEGFGGWVGFRDVVEADGARIPDRQGRLLRVLSASSGSTDEARRLSDESARFNIGPIVRNFNVPTAPLFFFRPDSLDRFKFTRKRVEPGGIWEIAFRETERPTLIRTPEGQSIPSEGSVWVNAADGTVVRTSLRMNKFAAAGNAKREFSSAQVDVTYARVAALDMWLPETMKESYEANRGPLVDRVTAEARYSDYRQFQTSVRIK
jgi:hypothetical protein